MIGGLKIAASYGPKSASVLNKPVYSTSGWKWSARYLAPVRELVWLSELGSYPIEACINGNYAKDRAAVHLPLKSH
jgi:hypothetical protein